MSSFYGGKEGRTYHIVARFDSVHQMVVQFQKGGAYTDANYGEYVLIDTIKNLNQRSNPQNGLLFRRGFDYNESEATKPDIESSEFYDENNNLIKNLWNKAWSDWVAAPGGGAIYVGQIVGSTGQSPEVIPVVWNDDFAISAVKGDFSKGKEVDEQTGDISYHDDVRIGHVTVKDEDGNITGAELAFDIPSTVFEASIASSDAYAEAGVEEDDISKNHPFYYKWNFTLPNGKHGTDIYQMVKEEGLDLKYKKTNDQQIEEGKNYYTKEENGYSLVEEPDVSQIENYYEASGLVVDGELNQIVDGDQYITYSSRDYSETAEGVETVHLGRWPYRVIDRFILHYKERVFFDWSAGQTEDEQESVTIGTVWNSGEIDENSNLICAVCIHAGHVLLGHEPTGPFTVGQQFDAPDVISGSPSKWRVMILPEAAPADSAIVDYKAGQSDPIDLMRSIDYVTMDQNGNMFVYYSDSDIPYYLMTSRTLGEVNYNDDLGQIEIRYKGESNASIKPFYTIKNITLQNSTLKLTYVQGGQTHIETFPFPMLASSEAIKLENQDDITNINGMYFTYSLQGSGKYPASDPLNFPIAFKRQGESLLVLYSDPAVRAAIPSDKAYISDWTDSRTGKSYSNLRWYNFGPIGAQYHAWGEYTLEQLKTTYANGLGNDEATKDKEGWLVTTTYIKTGDTDPTRYVLAYDYADDPSNPSHELPDGTASCWYQIMSVDQAVASDPLYNLLVSEVNSSDLPVESDAKLQINGLWFVVSGGHDQEPQP